MRSILRSAVLAGSVLSLSFALAGCDDASKTTPPATPEVKGGGMEPGKNAMEPDKGGMESKGGMEPKGAMAPKDAMEPTTPKVETPAPAPDAPK